MYVHPFWFGVVVTVLVEMVGLFGYAMILMYRRSKK